MTRLEKTELASIPLAGIGAWLVAPLLPGRPTPGDLLLTAAALLLLQGLIRDIGLLAVRGRDTKAANMPARCLCVESAVGAGGVAAGLGLLGVGIGAPFALPAWGWGLLVIAVTTTGFALKDYVVGWPPWRFRREPDHLSLAVYRKR